MANAEDLQIDLRVVGQPECCRGLREKGWKFSYNEDTWFVYAEHPFGGRRTVVEVLRRGLSLQEINEIGEQIAMLLNGGGS